MSFLCEETPNQTRIVKLILTVNLKTFPSLTCLRLLCPQSAYNNLCWSDEARRHLYFHWSVNFYFYLGEALFAAPSFSNLHLKTIKFLYLYYRMLRHY
jgi:hypothetical protein